MKKQKGFTALELFLVLVWLVFVVSWIKNAYELVHCDFEAPYKAEAIHAIGLIPLMSPFTAWTDVGK